MSMSCSICGRNEECIQNFGHRIWEKNHLEDVGVGYHENGSWKNGKWKCEVASAGTEQGQMTGVCECGDELSCTTKAGNFFFSQITTECNDSAPTLFIRKETCMVLYMCPTIKFWTKCQFLWNLMWTTWHWSPFYIHSF